MIIDEIKQRNLQAIKEKDANARAILSIVMNKYLVVTIEKRSKQEEMTDVDMVAILQKTIKELNEEMDTYVKAGRSEQAEEIKAQKAILENYLPKMMSEDEISGIINNLEDKSIGNVMKHFKANYAGKCDMGVVQKVLKNMK